MRVLTISGFAPYWGRYPPNILDLDSGPTVGGGEEAFLRTAVGLAKLGHDVVAYHPGLSGSWRGVEFRGKEKPLWPALEQGPWDAVLTWSSIQELAHAPKGARRVFCQQLNDLSCPGDWSKVDCVVSPSLDHAVQVERWGWKGNRAVVHNGLDLELYWKVNSDMGALMPPTWEDWQSRPFSVGYWSSPDRGLHHLLRAWPLVVEKAPDAKLHVFYEMERLFNMVLPLPMGLGGARIAELKTLVDGLRGDPSVVFHGAVTRKELARWQTQTRVHCYPYDPFGYCEGFAGAVNQGLAAGCTVMTTWKDALPSLYDGGVHWLKDDMIKGDYSHRLANAILNGLHGTLQDQQHRTEAAPKIASRFTWDAAAKEMERACTGEGWF